MKNKRVKLNRDFNIPHPSEIGSNIMIPMSPDINVIVAYLEYLNFRYKVIQLGENKASISILTDEGWFTIWSTYVLEEINKQLENAGLDIELPEINVNVNVDKVNEFFNKIIESENKE